MEGITVRNLKSDYGIDTPKVVRNLFLTGSAGLIIWLTTLFKLWTGNLVIGPIGPVSLNFPMDSIGIFSCFGCYGMAFWMIWSSKVGKIKTREKLLKNINWQGSEQVLDIGCGRGLMLIGAAKRLTTGKATGIDIWQEEDLSGNNMNAVLRNIRIEDVTEKAIVKTADMRQLPFGDKTFDIILSCSAIHNLYDKKERGKAIAEIVRVLKPGGIALIDDIRHYTEYAAAFKHNGCTDIKKINSMIGEFIETIITFGSLHPMTIIVKKPLN